MDGFGFPSAMFVYNDAVGHVTRFQPPDWLPTCTGVSRSTVGIVSLPSFPRSCPMAAEAL